MMGACCHPPSVLTLCRQLDRDERTIQRSYFSFFHVLFTCETGPTFENVLR